MQSRCASHPHAGCRCGSALGEFLELGQHGFFQQLGQLFDDEGVFARVPVPSLTQWIEFFTSSARSTGVTTGQHDGVELNPSGVGMDLALLLAHFSRNGPGLGLDFAPGHGGTFTLKSLIAHVAPNVVNHS